MVPLASMTNILSDDKRQDVLALGRLGWTLRRIEQATGVRRETASAYLKAAGLAVRPPGRWGHPAANPAIEVSTDPGALPPGLSTPLHTPPPPGRSPTASACAPYRELIEGALGPRPRRHGDLARPRRRSRLSRPVRERPALRPRAPRAAARRGAPGDRHGARGGRPGRLRRRPDGAASGHGQVPPHAAVRLHPGLQPQERPPADLSVEHPALGRAARGDVSPAGRRRAGRRPRQSCARAC